MDGVGFLSANKKSKKITIFLAIFITSPSRKYRQISQEIAEEYKFYSVCFPANPEGTPPHPPIPMFVCSPKARGYAHKNIGMGGVGIGEGAILSSKHAFPGYFLRNLTAFPGRRHYSLADSPGRIGAVVRHGASGPRTVVVVCGDS